MTHTVTLTVSEQHLASSLGSGDLPVLATPAMVALMENAAMLCIRPSLADGETTVGSRISVSHLRPTSLGHSVSATATLLSREGRKLVFRVEASDANGLMGEGEHVRYVVNAEKFMGKM